MIIDRSNTTVLVVDDTEAQRYAIARILERAGFHVLQCGTGGEALAIASTAVIDVMVLDVHLPDMDGRDVAARMKREPRLALIPILQVSAVDHTRDGRILSLERGADAFLQQPADPQELVATITALARTRAVAVQRARIARLHERAKTSRRFDKEKQRRRESEQARSEIEQLYRMLFETAEEGIWILDPDRRTILVNPRMLSILGREEEELILDSDPIDAFVHPDDRRIAHRMQSDVEQSLVLRRAEVRLLRGDGTSVICATTGRPLLEDGEFAGTLLMVMDISAQAEAERCVRIARSEADRLASIVESTSDAVISISPNGTIESWNRGAERLYGYTAEEIVGRSQDSMLPPDKQSRFAGMLDRLRAGENIENYETVRIAKSGEHKPVALTISAIRDASGELIGISQIARDLSPRLRAEHLEQELRQAQKLEAIGQLAGGVAHDFNNILMVISSYTEQLQSHLQDATERGALEEIMKATARASSLTQQLLSFSRRQSNELQRMDLNVAVHETLKMLRRLINEDIDLSFEPGETFPVLFHSGQLVQVLVNMCVNARDAMPCGGRLCIATRALTVADEGESEHRLPPGNYAVLSVSDTGVGMDSETLSRVFEPFFTTKEQGKGTGLGLATVYGLVRQANGFVFVDSALNAGTTFSIYFPAADALSEVPTEVCEPLPDVSGKRILLVEDEAGVRQAIGIFLRHLGNHVFEADNGEVAVSVAREIEAKFDLLITDVVMPKLGGPEAAARLMTEQPQLRVLFMSGYTDDQPLPHLGADPRVGYLQKPFTMSALAAKLASLFAATSELPEQVLTP